MGELKIDIKEIHYHRNGIGGWPFYVAIAESEEDGIKEEMLIIKHDPGDFKDDPERKKNYLDTVWNFGIPIAVFNLDKLAQRKVNTIANVGEEEGNSMRGDNFDSAMQEGIEKHREEFDKKLEEWKEKNGEKGD